MDIVQELLAGRYDTALAKLYGSENVDAARERYLDAAAKFEKRFGHREQVYLCSAPGRTELSGNHTDHNHGRTLAASVQLDIISVVAPTDNGHVCEQSEGFAAVELDLNDLAARPQERGTSAALIRGVAARLAENGAALGGFDAYSISQVPQGSGLSSSAAYEILVGTIFNVLYNDSRISSTALAMAAQYAENVYFGKPCGLLDQMACATGGAVAMDFADPSAPAVRSIAVDFADYDRMLCIVDTGGSHADLTDDYAAVTAEMRAVSRELGVNFLRETTRGAVMARSAALRQTCGDRAVLRALHFFAEDERADRMAAALETGDITTYEKLMRESGRSSFQFLQNLYTTKDVRRQGLPLAICVAEQTLGDDGAARVHGGGFAGAAQALVPLTRLDEFRAAMELVFGKGCCHPLRIRPVGGVCLDDLC